MIRFEPQAKNLMAAPKHWRWTRLSRIVRFKNGVDYKTVETDEPGYPVYGSGGLFRWANDWLHDGPSVLFGRKGTIDRPLYVEGKFWTVDTMFYTVPDESNIHPKFLYYWATRFPFGKYMSNTALPSMTQSDLGSEPIAIPPLFEQQLIVDYLDQETAEIDAFIEEAELLAELEDERAATQFSSWLTNGTGETTTRTKAHQVEWLYGVDIPTHWKSVKLGLITRLRSGSSIRGIDIETSGDFPVYGGGGLRGYTSTWTHQEDHVMFGRQGALCGQVFLGQGPFYATEHAVVVTPTVELDSKWLESMLRFMNLRQYSTSAAQPGLSVEDISKLKVLQPPKTEQSVIAGKIAEYELAVAATKDDLNDAIELAQERRAALISAAVTGQIDVAQKHKPVAEVLEDEAGVRV